MKLIFLSFANSQHDPLPSLLREDDGIYRALMPRALQQQYLLHRDSYTSVEKIAEYITLVRDHLLLFHYSGHAGRDALLLDDEKASALGISKLLGQCPELKIVVLNGCSTQGQVQQLLDAGVPVVIATSAPVEDMKAMRFGIRLHKALSEGATIGEAFDLAVAEVLTLDDSLADKIFRDVSFLKTQNEEPIWGIFSLSENEGVLTTTLPTTVIHPKAIDVEPNEYLIEKLWTGLNPYNDEIALLAKKKRLSLPRKRMAILNALPAPIAEHLRKLMVPIKDEAGFNQLTQQRLAQIVLTYQTVMELVSYTLLGQLWETFFERGRLNIADDRKALIRNFLQLPPKSQEVYDYLALIRYLCEIIKVNEGRFFIEALEDFQEVLYQEGELQNAGFFLEVLKVKLHKESVAPADIPDLCRRAEESLADLLAGMGFLAQYALVSVQSIDVLKYRHLPDAKFNHIAVELRDLLGGLEVTDIEMQRFMDNQSVLLLNEMNDTYLNISPFIIDANAFEAKEGVATIYFVSHFEQSDDSYCFKWIYDPEAEEEWIQVGAQTKYDIVKKQFDAFKQLLA